MSNFTMYFRFFISGLAFGIANVIPGVSGGTMLVVFGIYDKLTEAISGIKNIFKNIGFLISFAVGAGAGILGFAYVITFLFGKFGVQTNMFFIGLILGSIPLIIRNATKDEKIKPLCIVPFIVGLAAVISLTLLEGAGANEPYSFTVETVKHDYGYISEITIMNDSKRPIDEWSIEINGDNFFDPLAKNADGAEIVIHHSTLESIKGLFADVPDDFNMIESLDDSQIPPNSTYTFTVQNNTEIKEENMELSVSYAMSPGFFFTMLIALFLAAVAMIIPGVSGSFVMMLLGVYSTVLAALKELDFAIIIPCAIGALLGIMLGARLISTLIKKHGLMMYSAIMGLVIGSVYAILPTGFGFNLQTGYGFVCMIFGVLVSTVIDKCGKTNIEEK